MEFDIAIPETIPEMNDLMEVHNMLAETAEEWTREWKQEGRKEGEAAMLLKQMRRKFGQVPDEITVKVQSAKLERIETWIDNFVFANSLDDVFAS